MPFRRSSRTIWRGRAAGASCCGSRTSTARAAGPSWRDEFRADLAWLGLEWDESAAAIDAAGELRRGGASGCEAMGLLYPCRCTRAEIAAAATRAGPDGPVYPGTCRGRAVDPDGACVAARCGQGAGADRPARLGRRTGRRAARAARAVRRRRCWCARTRPASYHLAATLDDAADGVTLVTRGHGPVRRDATSTACCRRCSGCRCRSGTITRCCVDADGTQARQAARLALAGRPAPRAARTGRRLPKPCARTASPLAFRSARA